MTEQTYLSQIQAGREGFVYLLHAEGTTRYKIGRSVNPISRMSEIQKQSPYPLKIVRSFWTLDAIADEATLHKWYARYRVFGEWFELGGMTDRILSRPLHAWETKLNDVEMGFDHNPTMHNLASDVTKHLCDWLGAEYSESNMGIETNILELYCDLLTDRKEVILTEKFLRETLPELAVSTYRNSYWEILDGKPSDDFKGFLLGAIETFVTVGLNKRTRSYQFFLKEIARLSSNGEVQ